MCTGEKLQPAKNPSVSADATETYGFTTPQDKIRRTQSGPSDQQSREKTSMPSDHSRAAGKVKKSKKQKKHMKKHTKAGGQTEPNNETKPDAPTEQLDNSNPPQTAETGNPPDGGATNVVKPEGTALPETAVPNKTRKTAAKSMAMPPKTEDDGVKAESDDDEEHEEADDDEGEETKPEPQETPGPPSEVRKKNVATAATENLRRPSTEQQLEKTPPPAPDASDSNQAKTGPEVTPETDGTPGNGGGRKKRREKTVQEKAMHARYMKFSRHIKSA
eukprot:s1407_g3.t1